MLASAVFPTNLILVGGCKPLINLVSTYTTLFQSIAVMTDGHYVEEEPTVNRKLDE